MSPNHAYPRHRPRSYPQPQAPPLSRYKSAVETLYDEDKPETEAVVHNSLRALLVVSALMSRGSSASLDAELDAELDAVLVEDELLGEDEDTPALEPGEDPSEAAPTPAPEAQA